VKTAPAITATLQKAMALHQGGEIERAMQLYREVLTKEPEQADALHLLGAAHWQKTELDEAEKLIRRAIAVWGKEAAYFADLGGVLNQKNAIDEAITAYKMALKLDPHHKNARNGLANAYGRKGFEASRTYQWEEAEEAYGKLLALKPGDPAALNNLGEIRHHAGDRAKAEQFYSEALAQRPDYDIVRFNRGICRLGLENLTGGWADLAASTTDWLPRMDDGKNIPWLRVPLWDGGDLKDKKILLWGNQGIGDEILFASMIPDLLARGAKVSVECMDRLAPLFARSFPGVTIGIRRNLPQFGPADFDVQAPGLWLGRWVRPHFASFPERRAYLKADAAKTEAFRARYLAMGKKRVVGISWHTKSQGRADARRLSLQELVRALAPKFSFAETLFVDLQYGDHRAEREEVAQAHPGFTLDHDPDVDQLLDMDIFAAQLAACDEIVSIGNTTAHLAGALGVKGQILIPLAGLTWYWFETRENSPWYPSLRLLRKTEEGNWKGALQKLSPAES
jgi:tetratricopeptide (TPR) repeat protein